MSFEISPENIRRHISFLTDRIGVRVPGSDAEKRAAEYMRQCFSESVPLCRTEDFPVIEQCVSMEKLSVRIHGEWSEFPCLLFTGSAATGGKPVSSDLIFFDGHTDYQRADLSFLSGKAVIHYGAHVMEEENYRRLMAARPAFLLMVDTRHPGPYPVADGLFPQFVEKYGSVPTAGVAFYDVWRWMTESADRAVLTVDSDRRPGISRNVIAEIPGADRKCIYVGAHHDTAPKSVGADDNAVGCAMLLELARILARKPHKHSIRLISFGSEEILSVGSASYVRRHRREVEQDGIFMLNFDSCGTAVGWNYFILSAGDSVCRRVREICREHDVYYQESREPEPFQDMFPFSAAGLPGLAFERGNNETGLFYHHRFDNTADKISAEIVASLATAAAAIICELADGDPAWCSPCTDARHKEYIRSSWENVFGGWDLPSGAEEPI